MIPLFDNKNALLHLEFFFKRLQSQRKEAINLDNATRVKDIDNSIEDLKQVLFEALLSSDYSVEFNGKDILFKLKESPSPSRSLKEK
jgi:hypothetical protein